MKKVNNKILIVTLVVLLAIWGVSKVFRAPSLESNVRKELVKLDTAALTEIKIQKGSDVATLIRFTRTGKKWSLENNGKKWAADEIAVKGLLELAAGLETERMVSRRKEKWDTYQVGANGIIASFLTESDLKASLVIGKSNFTPGGNGMMGGSATTYVRLSDEDEVYVADGFLESSVGRPVNDWRDKSFLRIPREQITKISFSYPADSSFVIEKRDSLWQSAGASLDKMKVDAFLTQLASKNLSAFANDFNAATSPTATITIEGASGVLCSVHAWKTESTWLFRSSRQPEVVFSASGSSIDKDLLKRRADFLSEAK